MIETGRAVLPAIISGTFGGVWFASLAGRGIVHPTQFLWVFQGDWQWHFLGWHFFRNEPWHWPPGLLTSYLQPIGSALGYTDSIPIAAFLLKPFVSVLPNPMQYLGLWLVLCFALQGAFGSILIGAWTRNVALRTIGGCLFVLAPALLGRLGHPALCAHWLLLWALWLAVREPAPSGARGLLQHASLGLISGLIHPYLAVMVMIILASLPARRAIVDGVRGLLDGATQFGVAIAAVIAGWWASGLLSITSADDLVSTGLGVFSSNLLGIVNPGPRARFLPALPWMSAEQHWEGLQYFGAGMLVLSVIAIAIAAVRVRRLPLAWTPLIVCVGACFLYSLSPRVTAGDRVLIDLLPYVSGSSMFRATARFFWPFGYALMAVVIGLVCTSLRARVAVPLVAGALVLQYVDLRPWYTQLHDGFRNPQFLGAHLPLPSPEWQEVLSHYERIRIYWPQLCGGPMPIAMAYSGFIAGLHGASLNDGFAARVDAARVAAECGHLRGQFAVGVVDDHTVYFLAPAVLGEFQARADVACRTIDAIPVCVTKSSDARAALQW